MSGMKQRSDVGYTYLDTIMSSGDFILLQPHWQIRFSSTDIPVIKENVRHKGRTLLW
jgi:hypothetical protein